MKDNILFIKKTSKRLTLQAMSKEEDQIEGFLDKSTSGSCFS